MITALGPVEPGDSTAGLTSNSEKLISGLTLLRADESPSARERWSYLLLVEELRRVAGDPQKHAAELFRRVCFNALISNLDDHPRNHAVIAKGRDWKLSPAYDLTPTPAVAQECQDPAMPCGDLGRYANAQNILPQHARFLLKHEQAAAIVVAMKEQVASTWYGVVRASGVSEADAEIIRPAFVYEGFSL